MANPEPELAELPPLAEAPGTEEGAEPDQQPSQPRQRQSRTSGSSSASAGRRNRRGPKGPPSKAEQLGDIHQGLEDLFVAIGTVSTPILPTTGLTLVKRGPQGADAITNLAEKDARVYRALVRLLKYSAWAELTMFAACIAVAVAVDAGTIPADNLIALRFLGEDVVGEVVQRGSDRAAAHGARAIFGPAAWAPGAAEPTG